MDILQGMVQGFSVCLEPTKLLACFFGVLVGTAIGVLPGIGPSGAVALLIPLTFHMDAASAVIMIAGIYYGTQYGGSTTSILVNVPGEAASVITCLDGYQMARQGRAGAALGISAFGSFIAGTIGVIGLMVVAPPLAEFALKFGPPEIFALVFLAFTLVAFPEQRLHDQSLMMAVLGLLLATVGQEAITAIPRFTFGSVDLQAGPGPGPPDHGAFRGQRGSSFPGRHKARGRRRYGAAYPQILGFVSEPPGLEEIRPPDRQRIVAWLFDRTSSGRNRDHRVLCILRDREENLQASGAVRARGDRRGGRAGVGQ